MNPAGLPAPAECAQGESRCSAGSAACDTPSAGDGGDRAGGGSGRGGEPLGGRAGKVSVGQGRCGGGMVTKRARGEGEKEALLPGPPVPEEAAAAARGAERGW